MVKIRIPRASQPSRSTLEAEINRLKQELETERSSNKQLRASLDVMQIGWDSDRQKLLEAAKSESSSLLKDIGTNTMEMRLQEMGTCTNSEVHNLSLQSKKASLASQVLENFRKPLLACSLCCKETFPNLEQYRKHLTVITNSLKCPFCIKTFCLCSLSKHLEKGCHRMNMEKAPNRFMPQAIWTKEVETQTTESSTLPAQDLFGMVSVKMVKTIDKNGIQRLLPHITMEPYFKSNIQIQKTVASSEQNGDIQIEVPSVQKVPADSSSTYSSSPVHSNIHQPDHQISKSPKNCSTENVKSQEPQTRSKLSPSIENFEKKLSRGKQSDKTEKKQTEQSSETSKVQEKKKEGKLDVKLTSPVVSKSPNEKSGKSAEKSSVFKSQLSEKLVSLLKSNNPVEKSSPEFAKSKYEKKDKDVEILSSSGTPNSHAEKNGKAEEKRNSNSLQTPNTLKSKQSEQSHSTDVSKSGSEKKINKTSKSSLSQSNKNTDLARLSSSSEIPKTPDKKHSKLGEKSSLDASVKHQSINENINGEPLEKLAPVLKSKDDKPNPQKSISENQGKNNTPTSEKKKEASQKNEIKEGKVEGVKDKESISGSNNESNSRSSNKGDFHNGIDLKSSANSSDRKYSESGSNIGSSADASTSGGNGNDEFYCSACEVYFKSVVQHLEVYHAGEEVEIEDEAYQEVPDELRQKLVCKAETEVTVKVKEMLSSTDKKVESNQSPKESGSKKRKKKKGLLREKKNFKMDSKYLESHLTKLAGEAENKSKDEKEDIFKCKDCEAVFSKQLLLQQHLCKSVIEKNSYACNQCNETLPLTKELSHRKMHIEERKILRDRSKKSQTKETSPCQKKLTEEDNQTRTIPLHNMPHCEVLLKDIGDKHSLVKCKQPKMPSLEEDIGDKHSLVKRKQPKMPSLEDEEFSKAKKPLLKNSKEVDKLSKDNCKDVALVEVPLIENSLEVDARTPSTDNNKSVVEHIGKDNENKPLLMKDFQNVVEVKTPSANDLKNVGGKIKKWKNWREKIRETNPECLANNKSVKKIKKQTSSETSKKSIDKTLKMDNQKPCTSANVQMEATSPKSVLKVAAFKRSPLPTKAKDYWKIQREELKNDIKKWKSFLVEEQERFKERLEKEKNETDITQSEADENKVKPEALKMDESQVDALSKTSDNPYKCVLCLNEFTSLRQAEKHKLLHDKEDAYHCSYCPCVYQLRVLLDEHLSNEHGQIQD